jgi:radical SAM protein with 4Fe4S-binding SPASM domain
MQTQNEEEIDGATFDLLLSCNRPQPTETLLRDYPTNQIEWLLERELLVDAGAVWDFTVSRIEIETSTHCNWRCTFCPQSVDPKSISYMEPALFDDIVSKAERYGHIKVASIIAYNEPTLDKHFESRILRLADTAIKLQLHTNGSGLTEKKVDLLAETGVLSALYFNLPTIDPDEFVKLTGFKHLPQVIANIRYAIERGLPVDFSVQGLPSERERNYLEIYRFFGLDPEHAGQCTCALCESTARITTDRAGLMDNEYFQSVNVGARRLNGCGSPLEYLYLSVHGDCYLCSEDYHQRWVFGRIQDGEIEKILRSEAAQEMLAWVFGVSDAPADFICRKCVVMRKSGHTLASLRPRSGPMKSCS